VKRVLTNKKRHKNAAVERHTGSTVDVVFRSESWNE